MKLSLLALAAILVAPSAYGWTLDGGASTISYVSMKNADTAESNLLPGLSGTVADDGTARIEIDLKSVETYVDIRNERMQEHLFRVTEFPVATLAAKLDMDGFAGLGEGATAVTEFWVTVAANGEEMEYPVKAKVTRVAGDRVAVASREPVIIYADELGYVDGINTLRELAGLESIQLAVPVSFSLVFAQ